MTRLYPRTDMIAETRPVPFADVFEALAISESALSGIGTVHALDRAASLAECVEAATGRVSHKGKFLVRHTDRLTGKAMLHFYQVKRKSKAAHRYHEYQTRAVHDHYAELLLVLDADALGDRFNAIVEVKS